MNRHSLKFKIVLVFAVTIIAFQMIFSAFSAFFLDDLLALGAKMAMEKQFHQFYEGVKMDGSSKTYQAMMEQLSYENGASMTYINLKTQEMMTTSPGMMHNDMRNNRQMNLLQVIQENMSLKEGQYFETTTGRFDPNRNFQLLVGRIGEGFLVIEKPVLAVQESLNLLRQYILLSSLGLIILGTIVFYNYSRKIATPIIEIEKQAQAIAAQRFDIRTNVEGEDEIGQLGRAMNSISDRLQLSLQELNLANEKLRDEIAAERRLEKMRRSFVSNVSHELKTPLSMIMGYADGLIHKVAKTPDQIQDYCTIIVDESQKMNRLIKDLLDLSAYENGTFKILQEPLELSSALESMVHHYETLAQYKQVLLESFVQGDLYLQADRMRLEQAFRNIMDNAFKHTESHRHIWVHAQRLHEWIELSVENEGRHIPPEEIEHLWESFYRGQYDQDQGYEGTGLGLSIVKAVISGHRGTLSIMNTEAGVKVLIRLPISLNT